MKLAHDRSWEVQNDRDKTLGRLQEVDVFARSLLSEALKNQYNIVLDVHTTYLRLYCPKGQVGGFDVRTLSLLEAALHNFEIIETRAGYFDAASAFITRPSPSGQFDILPIKHQLSIEAFAALCRELDIGAQYQAYLKEFMGFANPVARAVLQARIQASDKAALHAASVLALMKKDIDHPTHQLLLSLIGGKPVPTLHGKRMHCYELAMMDAELTGIVLIAADLELSRHTEQVIVYVPHDPEHPVKQYPSTAQFVAELTCQLRVPEYQRFFSRFVPQQQRGTFFAHLNQMLSSVRWHTQTALDQIPPWREEPLENPNLRMVCTRISVDFWSHDFQQKLNKILNDARAIAVSTDDEDLKSRWARWDSLQKVAAAVLEVAAFVATPFVPLLGEAMLAYTAFQLLDETFEGIVEWSEGQRIEAAGHLIGVAESIVQLGIFAEGGAVAGALLPHKPSLFVEGLKVVETGNGQSRLWHPDLARYEQPRILGENARPEANGLYKHQGQDVLALDGKHFVVRQEPGLDRYRIQHPTRADAYAPRLAHNGLGAWSHEAERPLAWQGATLMRRLGHSVETFTDQTLEQIRVVSGIEEDVLRKLHVEHERPPAMLVETIKRFRAEQDVQIFITQMSSHDPRVYGKADLRTQLELLTRHGDWPRARAVQLLDSQGKVHWQYEPEPSGSLLQIHEGRPGHDDLAKTLLTILEEQEIKVLLHEEFGAGPIALEVRASRLRALVARLAETKKAERVEARYAFGEDLAEANVSPYVQLLGDDFAQLPRTVMEELLVNASPAELQQLSDDGHVPLRLRQAARAARLEIRVARAYEGLYLESSENLDTARLTLHSLETLTGWTGDVRIEMRGISFGGPLLDSIGPVEALVRKVLVLTDEGGFQSYDDEGNSLHGVDDIYTSILQALPDSERRALGHEIGQGRQLKKAVQLAPLSRDAFRNVVLEHPIRKPAYDPAVMRLRGGMQGYEAMAIEQSGTPGPSERFKVLYPGTTTHGFAEFMQSFASEAQALASIRGRELEFEGLSKRLDDWAAIERGDVMPMDQRYHKGRFAKAIKQCWQAGGQALPEGYALDLNFHWTGDFLEDLPALNADFGHVTSLQFRHVALHTDISGFLQHFPNLKVLDLSHNLLIRPPRLREHLSRLQVLDLSNNQLRLTPESTADVGGLTRLETLRLSNNPALTLLPDVSRMPELGMLDLQQTGVSDWPPGLFALTRPRSFELNLEDNPINRIPQVTPGSEQARLIARTRLSRNELADENRRQFQDYMRSVGYDPARSYPPKGEETSEYWLEGVVGQQRTVRQKTWDELEKEPEAQGFFEVLEQLTESADYVDEARRPGLADRVWRTLDAASENTPLREALFRMAINPDSCADAGAQIFNEMGSKVLVHEAYRASTPDEIEAGLLTLAKGKSRLDQVNEIARATIQRRLQAGESFQALDEDGEVTGTIDEVEVYLAFQTGLAQRLELPWQSQGMLFREMAEVDDAAIDQAYQSVLALEAGDGLVNRIIDQSFWRKYLKGRYPRDFKQNSALYNEKSEALLEQQLAGSISQQEYEQEMTELADARKALLRRLTRETMIKWL